MASTILPRRHEDNNKEGGYHFLNHFLNAWCTTEIVVILLLSYRAIMGREVVSVLALYL